MATPINRTLDPLGMQRATLGFKEQVDAVTRSLSQQSTTATKTAASTAAAFERQQLAAMRAQAQVNSLTDAIARAQSSGAINANQAAALTARAQAAGTQYNNQMQMPKLNSQAMLAEQLNLKKNLQGIQRDFQQTARSVAPLQAGIHGLVDVFSMTAGPLNGLTFRLRASQDMMQNYGMVAGATAAALSGLAITMVGLGGQILDITIQYQKAEQTLKGLLGSTSLARAEIDYLRDVSNQAGLAFASLAPQFSRFVSAAEGSGQGLSETNEQFRQMSLLAGTLHLTTDEVNRVLLAFDQMLSAGRIMGDDMRQLRNVLPAAYEAAGRAAEKMGTSFKDASGKINDLNPSEFISQLLDEYMKMFNIDMSKPIDTLQADLNRITNSWQNFILNLSEGIGASEKFQAVFDAISNTLTGFGNNIEIVISVVGGLAGALTGLFAAMAAMSLIQGAIATWTALNTVIGLSTTLFVGARTALFGYSVATTGAALTTTQLTAAQHGLNAAMSANPIGLVVRVLATLALALWGAKTAYDAVNGAVRQNMMQMNDLSGFNAYIEKQKEMGKNITAVTNSMKQQLATMIALNQANIQQAQTAANSALRENRLGAALYDNRPLAQNGTVFYQGRFMKVSEYRTMVRRGMDAAYNEYNALVQNGRNLEQTLAGLNDLGKLPEDKGFGESSNLGKGDKPDKPRAAPDPDRGLRQFNDIINRAHDAQILLDNMWRGPTHSGLFDALNDVRKQLFDMDTDQLKRLGELLEAGNIDVGALGGLEAALTVVTMTTRQAEDAVKRFNKVWEDLDKGEEQLQAINRQIEYLSFGGDPEQMFLVDAMNKARDTIRELTTQDLPTLRSSLESFTNKSGERVFNDTAIGQIIAAAEGSNVEALAALNRALVSMGYNIQSTGDEASDAQANLASYFESLEGGADQLNRVQGFFSSFNDSVREFQQQQRLMGATSLGQIIDIEALNRASDATRYLDETALAGLRQQLQGLGFIGDDVTQVLARFYRTMDENDITLDRQREALDATTEAWTSFADASVDALTDVLLEGESFSDAMLGILNDLSRTIVNAAIFDPLKRNLTNTITDIMSGRGGGASDIMGDLWGGAKSIFGIRSGSQGGDATSGVNALNQAAASAGNLLNGNFAAGLLQSVMGMSAETSATTVFTGQLLGASMALTTFSTALLASSAMSAAQGAADMAGGFGNLLKFATFADGGHVFGPGGPRDDMINARLSAGEFVVNAQATKENLDLLHAINSGRRIPRFADGGEVTPEMAGIYSGGPSRSILTSNERPTKIDARSTFHIAGSVDRDTFEEMRAWAEERDRSLRDELPYLIDERVIDSSTRNRY